MPGRLSSYWGQSVDYRYVNIKKHRKKVVLSLKINSKRQEEKRGNISIASIKKQQLKSRFKIKNILGAKSFWCRFA